MIEKERKTVVDHEKSKKPKFSEPLVEKKCRIPISEKEQMQLNEQLILEAEYGETEKVKELLERGADVNARKYENLTALIEACQHGHKETAIILIQEGADINAKSDYGFTALTEAATYGHADIVKLLLDNGADVNDKGRYGIDSALAIASQRADYRIVQLLLDNGADIKANGCAIRRALSRGQFEMAEFLKRHIPESDNQVQQNQRKGLAPDEQERLNAKLFMCIDSLKNLVEKKQLGIVPVEHGAMLLITDYFRLLIDLGADVDSRNQYGETPLICAAGGDLNEIVSILLEKNADVNAKMDDGKDALMRAAIKSCHTQIIANLIGYGANPNARDNAGWIAARYAKASVHRLNGELRSCCINGREREYFEGKAWDASDNYDYLKLIGAAHWKKCNADNAPVVEYWQRFLR